LKTACCWNSDRPQSYVGLVVQAYERLEAHLIAHVALRCCALSISICVLCFVPP